MNDRALELPYLPLAVSSIGLSYRAVLNVDGSCVEDVQRTSIPENAKLDDEVVFSQQPRRHRHPHLCPLSMEAKHVNGIGAVWHSMTVVHQARLEQVVTLK